MKFLISLSYSHDQGCGLVLHKVIDQGNAKGSEITLS